MSRARSPSRVRRDASSASRAASRSVTGGGERARRRDGRRSRAGGRGDRRRRRRRRAGARGSCAAIADAGGAALAFAATSPTRRPSTRPSPTCVADARPRRRARQQRRHRLPLPGRGLPRGAVRRAWSRSTSRARSCRARRSAGRCSRRARGSIVNIASIGGFVAYPHASAYLASKGGVVQLTRALALEWIGAACA